MNEEKIIEVLINQQFTFAKSMPKIPHWYTLEKHWEDKGLYRQVVNYINANGYQKKFYNQVYTYLNIGEYKYWAMRITDGSGIINRTLINNNEDNFNSTNV